ncbi:MAG: nucleoside hydrolase [Nitrososphaerales archaeon]
MTRRVILDVDPGVDDALAILFAVKSKRLKVEAITTVSGNVHVDKGCLNALKMLEVLGEESIPVAKGESRPLMRPHIGAEHIHGQDGLGDSGIPTPRLEPVSEDAVDLIGRKVSESEKGEFTLVATAPLTNIAQAFKREPLLAEKLDRLVFMGGAYGLTEYGRGNVTSDAEYNIYEDPEAAQIVFQSGARITAVGLDVTMNPSTALISRHIEEMSSKPTPVTEVVRKITRKMLARWGRVYLHDPLAVAVAADESLVKTERHSVDIDVGEGAIRGRTTVRDNGTLDNDVDVCVDIDAPRFLDVFLTTIMSS